MSCPFCGQQIDSCAQAGRGRQISFTRCGTCGDYSVSPEVIALMANNLHLTDDLTIQLQEAIREHKILVAVLDGWSTELMITRIDYVVVRETMSLMESP